MAVAIVRSDNLTGAAGHESRDDDAKSLPARTAGAERQPPVEISEDGTRLERLAVRARAYITAERLARTLAPAVGAHQVGQLVMRAVGRAVGARIGSLAVREATGDQLAIVATLGYPLALVEHVRVPGAPGVLNTVYESRLPLRVSDVRQVAGVSRPRPRYSTPSCMAWPLIAGPDLIGILCVSDREDGQPFSVDDMSALRALAAPITLAVSRECARNEAEALAQAAALDPLTGLFNRRYFQHRLAEELERARRHGMPVALAMLDLDGFKDINDMFGHLVGDSVLREAAHMLRSAVRVFDVCTRFGGDEFAVVMPGSSCQSATRIAERIRERMAATSFGGTRGLQMTASIGVAVASSDFTAHELIAQADRALYLAKRAGRNRVTAVEGSSE